MTGSVTQRGDSFLLKWELPRSPEAPNKRRYGYKSVKVKTKKEARAILREILTSVDTGTYVAPQKMTVGAWADEWLKSYAAPAVSQKTLERYRELLTLHVSRHIGGIEIQKLTAPLIQGLYAKLRAVGKGPRHNVPGEDASGLSERTILHVHRVFSQCLKQARIAGVIVRNPAEDVKAPKPSKKNSSAGQGTRRTVIQALTGERLDELLKGFRAKSLFPIVATLAGTGMRRGEVLALRWSDVDLDKGYIRIERAIEDTKEHGVQINGWPKNDASRRTIGIDQGLAALLRQHWKAQAEAALKLGVRLSADTLVFPSSPVEPMQPRHPRAVTKEFTAHAKALGFNGFRLHDLRHTHATLLLTRGTTLNVVARRLGHSSPVITLSVYGHVLPEAEDQAVKVSGALLAGVLGAA